MRSASVPMMQNQSADRASWNFIKLPVPFEFRLAQILQTVLYVSEARYLSVTEFSMTLSIK